MGIKNRYLTIKRNQIPEILIEFDYDRYGEKYVVKNTFWNPDYIWAPYVPIVTEPIITKDTIISDAKVYQRLFNRYSEVEINPNFYSEITI